MTCKIKSASNLIFDVLSCVSLYSWILNTGVFLNYLPRSNEVVYVSSFYNLVFHTILVSVFHKRKHTRHDFTYIRLGAHVSMHFVLANYDLYHHKKIVLLIFFSFNECWLPQIRLHSQCHLC